MLKLYRLTETEKQYWETWDDAEDSHLIHWGALGSRGETRALRSSASNDARAEIQKEINALLEVGFAPIPMEEHATLVVEYAVDGMGSDADLAKRHQLEERLNETLGWTGLGMCDGGSIGSGSMEVFSFVVDFDLAKRVIEQDLSDTGFGNYTRIYGEDAE